MKGQLFMADVLASLLIITVLVAFTTWELDQSYNRASDLEFEKINSIASDVAQMAVKNILANRSSNTTLPNWINSSRWSLLTGNMSQMILPPYAYEASIAHSTLSVVGNGGCAARPNTASVRRIVYIDGTVQLFSVKVCI